MKTKTIFLCAVFLMTQAITYGSKTEVRVQKGKVIAQTASDTVTVDAGRKVVLSQDKELLVTVDDVLVQEVIKMYGWVEEEKAAGLYPIESVHIAVQSLDAEDVWRYSSLMEWTNRGTEVLSVIKLGYITTMDNPRFYDLKGNLLNYETESSGGATRYSLQFPETIEPGQKVSFIVVSKNYNRLWWASKSPIWTPIFQFNSQKPLLHLAKIVLPKSAILLGSHPKAFLTDMVEDRVALTFRDYIKDTRGSKVTVSFLWPDKDGTDLKDVPPGIRGLRDRRDVKLAKHYRDTLARILSGEKFHDMSTPLNSLLTYYYYLINEDPEGLRLVAIPFKDDDQEKLKNEMAAYKEYVVHFLDFFNTAPFPDDPQPDTIHSVQLSLKGTFFPAVTVDIIYKDGRWLLLKLNY